MRSNLVRALALILWLCLAASCSQGHKSTHGDDVRLAAGSWSISGIRIGDAFADIEQRLGPPSRTFKFRGAQGYGYKQPDITMVIDADEAVQSVSGPTLMHDDEVVLRVGESGSTVEAALGTGYRIERFAPKSRGIFTVGSVPGAIEHYYRDPDTRFHVFVHRDGNIGGIHAESLAVAEVTLPGVLTKPNAYR